MGDSEIFEYLAIWVFFGLFPLGPSRGPRHDFSGLRRKVAQNTATPSFAQNDLILSLKLLIYNFERTKKSYGHPKIFDLELNPGPWLRL